MNYLSFVLPQLIAQSINNPALGELGNLSPTAFFGNLLPALISLGFVVGAVFFIFYFILGGISWISSGGDKMKMEQARSRITTAIIGLVVLFCLYAILSLFENFFGIGFQGIEIGPFHIQLIGGSGSDGAAICSTLGAPPPCGSDCQTCVIGGDSICWNTGACPD